MQKTRHQIFIESLRDPLRPKVVPKASSPKKDSPASHGHQSKQVSTDDLEKMFDKLFGAFDDDDTPGTESSE